MLRAFDSLALAEVESEKDTVTYDAMLARARRIGKDERSRRSHDDRLLVLRSLSSQSDDRRLEVWAANASGPHIGRPHCSRRDSCVSLLTVRRIGVHGVTRTRTSAASRRGLPGSDRRSATRCRSRRPAGSPCRRRAGSFRPCAERPRRRAARGRRCGSHVLAEGRALAGRQSAYSSRRRSQPEWCGRFSSSRPSELTRVDGGRGFWPRHRPEVVAIS